MTNVPPNTAWNARVNKGPGEIYRQEAARLRMMAESHSFASVRDGLLDMAHQYDTMASQAESIRGHSFGQPFGRRGTPSRSA